MPRTIDKYKTRSVLGISSDRLRSLTDWLTVEVEDTLSARKMLEAEWLECDKLYNAVPKARTREVPVEGAPNTEITIGAMACDDIYAQAIDLIFNTTPLVTCQPIPKAADDRDTVDRVKALQRFTNRMAMNELGIYEACKHGIADVVQRGTMAFYTPWVQRRKKTRTAQILNAHPITRPIPPEDWVIFENNKGLQETIGTGVRFYRSEGEMNDYARANSWNLDHVSSIGGKDWVRTRREILGRQLESVERKGKIYEMYDLFVLYDIDGDGIDEELYVAYNHTGRWVAYVGYSPFDWRPIETAVYQVRPHLPYGLGVMEMMRPYEDEMTDIHNYAVLNALLANARVWAGNDVAETMKIWPGKVIDLEAEGQFQGIAMADVHPSIWQLQIMVMQLANRRVGMSELSSPQQVPGRTPGITMLSALQQVNRRFTPAFNDMRNCVAGAIKQGLFRYQEQLLAGSQKAADHITSILGPEDGMKVISLLRDENFDEFTNVELTAASASTNREADRQNAVMLVNVLGQYYQRMIELTAIASNPQTPDTVREVAKKVAVAASEIIDRTIRTFDQIRDPATFVVDVDAELQSSAGAAQEQAMQQMIMQLVGSLTGAGGGNGQGLLPAPYGEQERSMA